MIRKVFFTFFLVQMISYVTTVIGNIIDGIVTGSFLGTNALVAYGLVTPFLTVISALANAMSVGTSTLVSARLGKGDLHEMNRSFQVCFWSVLIFSVATGAAVFLFADPIATALQAEGEVHDMAVAYMRGYSIGIPPIFMTVLSMSILQVIGKRKILLISTVVLSGVNVLGDFLNVLVLQKGMFGMAVATTISYYVAVVIIILAISSKKNMLSIAPRKIDFAILREMVVYGTPVAVSMGARNVLVILLNNLILSIAGTQMVAAYAAITSAMNLIMGIGAGMSAATSVLTGIFAAEKDRQDLREVVKTSFIYSVIVNGLCIVAVILLAGPLVSLFLKDQTLLADAETGLRIVVLSAILFSVNFCMRSYLQAMKMLITIPYAIFNCLISIFCIAFVLGYTVGIIGVWASYPLGEAFTLLVYCVYAFFRNKHAKGVGFLERIMLIPKEFYDDGEPVEMNVTSIEDAVDVSERAKRYMEERGAEKRISLYAALAVEELTGNILHYGFQDGKAHHISVKVKKDCKQWMLRIRDDCRDFDPVTYLKSITPEEKHSHYGIRLIYGLAKEVKYVNIMHLNNLLIYL